MINKKRILALFLLAISVAFVSPSYAQYTPLVRLPGLPGTGSISLSTYLVGLYNFMVSIVGIVAVMMMIVGGMRYITAGGSQTAIGDAKEMVSSAVSGLVLAIFAWIIVAAINPDVLYIRQPGASFLPKQSGSCYKNFVLAPPTCKCRDSTVMPGPFADAQQCNDACMVNNCGINKFSCVRDGIDDLTDLVKFNFPDPNNGKCLCADGKDVAPNFAAVPPPTTCNQVCNDATKASDGLNHCGWDYLVVKADIRDNVCIPDTGGYEVDDILVHLQPGAELWEFYLTNDEEAENFNVPAKSWTTDTDPGAPVVLETFDCAVFSVNEDTWGCDEKIVYWVKKGAEIKSDGVSFYWDIMKSPDVLGNKKWFICPPLDTSINCNPQLSLLCLADYDLDTPGLSWGLNTCSGVLAVDAITGYGFIWYAKYGGPVISKCGDCSFSESSEVFRPAHTIRCDESDGKWHYK